MILTKAEIDALDKGPRTTIDIPKHKRKILNRTEQTRKNKKIYDFAWSWTAQLERLGITAADRRHMWNLIEVLKQELRK